jgi:hypothetical protein
MADDLLECECIGEQVRNNGVEVESRNPSENGDGKESFVNVDDPNVNEGNSDEEAMDDSDSEPTFMVASQYTGKPVSRWPQMTYSLP